MAAPASVTISSLTGRWHLVRNVFALLMDFTLTHGEQNSLGLTAKHAPTPWHALFGPKDDGVRQHQH